MIRIAMIVRRSADYKLDSTARHGVLRGDSLIVYFLRARSFIELEIFITDRSAQIAILKSSELR
jgi:hypothetical protein